MPLRFGIRPLRALLLLALLPALPACDTNDPDDSDGSAPVCGQATYQFNGPNGGISVATMTVSDPESGITSVTFTSLSNYEGFAGGDGPFEQGDSFSAGGSNTVTIRGERTSYYGSGTLVVTVTNNRGRTTQCDLEVSRDVTGTYDITEFIFDPNAAAIADADVLARLDPDETWLDLITTGQGGQFQLRYRLEGELLSIINGTYTVNQNQVTLSVGGAYQELLQELLLSSTIALQRVGDTTLRLDQTKTVNLEAYDPEQYGDAGLTSVQGTLRIRLELRDPDAE